jgi:hypothetical protein
MESFQIETSCCLGNKYNVEESEVKRILEAVTAVCELHTIFGLEKPRSQRWLDQRRTGNFSSWFKTMRVHHSRYNAVHHLLRFVSDNGTGSWVKLLKWKFAAFFAFYRGQDLPSRPDFKYTRTNDFWFKPSHLLGGVHHEFIMEMKQHDFDRFMQLADSSQQLKKAMPEVPRSMVEKAELDTLIELTTQPKSQSDFQGEVVLVEVDELGYSRFPERHFRSCKFSYNETYEEDFGPEIFEPTLWKEGCSACLQNTIRIYRRTTPVTISKVKEALKRTVKELFGDEELDHHQIFEPFFPSTSANYIWGRNDCGALAELYDRISFGKMDSGISFSVQKCSLFDRVSPHYGTLGQKESNLIASEKDLGYEPTEDYAVLLYDTMDLRRSWQEGYLKIFDLAENERPLVMTVGIPEPLKVRVISKGPPLLYTILKPFQKWLWSVLKKHRVFTLIGRYVQPEDIHTVLGEMADDEEAVSGDYVSSTNKLHSWVSETILDQLMVCLGENITTSSLSCLPVNFLVRLKALFLKALTKHVFVKKTTHCGHGCGQPCRICLKSGDYESEEFPQTEGQLMGSIISFPFLCIANAALCRLSIEESNFGQKVRLTNQPYPDSGPIAPLLINGDDCLLRGAKGRLRRCWEAFCAVAGLESSLGKTYFSDKFCTINSTIYELKNGKWVESKYVNLGLMMGKKRMGAGNSSYNPQVGIHQLGTISRELKRSCPSNLWPIVKKRFIYYNAKELQSFNVPWFVPEWLGGLGLPVDHPEEISRTDRLCCTIIKANAKKMKPAVPKEAAMWLMHKLVMKDLPELEAPLMKKGILENEKIFSLDDEYARLYKMMTINLLLKEPLDRLYSILNEDHNVKKAMFHNVNLYAQARKMIGSQSWEPMSDEDMAYENKALVIPCCERNYGWLTSSYYEDLSI